MSNKLQTSFPQNFGTAFLIFLFLLSSATGCGKDEEGIFLEVQRDDSENPIPENENYPDGFLTPVKARVGIKSAKLIKADETTPSFTIFDTDDPGDPFRMDLTTIPQLVAETSLFPEGCPCLFSKIELEVIFIDITVPTYLSGTETLRRFRFYTLPITDPLVRFPVLAGDLLIGPDDEDLNFSWIDLADGGFIPLSNTRPEDPVLQVPPARFPNDTYSSIVTVDLDPFLEIPDDVDGDLFPILASFQLGSLFFYDETDEEAPENGQFNILSDGLLDLNEPDSRYSSSFPFITASPN